MYGGNTQFITNEVKGMSSARDGIKASQTGGNVQTSKHQLQRQKDTVIEAYVSSSIKTKPSRTDAKGRLKSHQLDRATLDHHSLSNTNTGSTLHKYSSKKFQPLDQSEGSLESSLKFKRRGAETSSNYESYLLKFSELRQTSRSPPRT